MLKRLLFFHNAPMPYRIPLFHELAKHYFVKFYFTNLGIARKRYGLDFGDLKVSLGSLNYTVLSGLSGRLMSLLLSLREDYDVLIDSLEASSILTFLPARLRHKRTIYWSEELGWGNHSIKVQLGLLIKRYVARNCDAIIVPGTKHHDYFISLGVPENRITIAPNASDIGLWLNSKQIDLRERFSLKDNKIILYVGRLIRRKGVDVLIRAFSGVDIDSTLIVIGKGEMERELADLVKELGIDNRVIFVGYVPDCELSSYYQSADVCVVPSRGEGMLDPWVFVVNEAMHHGVPVIATTAVGAAYDMVIDGQTGFMVPEGDVPSLTATLNTVLGDSSQSKVMGCKAQELEREMFSYDRMKDMFTVAIEGRVLSA